MHIEYSNYDLSNNELELKKNIDIAIKYKPDSISVLPNYLKSVKNSMTDTNIQLSTVIDYPMGISDIQTRLLATEHAIKNGAQIIELVAPNFPLCNRKYDKFRADVHQHKELCDKFNAEIRYVLEYRVFTYDLLHKISQILVANNIYTIYPSTGHMLDELSDNILAAILIKKKTHNIRPIINGNIWNNRHIAMIENNKNNIFGYKVNSINALERICHIKTIK